MEDENMSDASSSSYMSIEEYNSNPFSINYEKVVAWKNQGYILPEVVDQGNTECCLPASLSECITIMLRWYYRDKSIPRVCIQYMMDCFPRTHSVNAESCTFEDAYDYLQNDGAVLEGTYEFPFTGRRNRPPGGLSSPGRYVRIDGFRLIFRPTRTDFEECVRRLEVEGPLVGRIVTTNSFLNWNGMGIYYPTSDHVIDALTGQISHHALVILDYVYDHNTSSLWFNVKNTHGVDWADHGYAWIDSTALTHISYPICPRLVVP